jgi:hypothetical protein
MWPKNHGAEGLIEILAKTTSKVNGLEGHRRSYSN